MEKALPCPSPFSVINRFSFWYGDRGGLRKRCPLIRPGGGGATRRRCNSADPPFNSEARPPAQSDGHSLEGRYRSPRGGSLLERGLRISVSVRGGEMSGQRHLRRRCSGVGNADVGSAEFSLSCVFRSSRLSQRGRPSSLAAPKVKRPPTSRRTTAAAEAQIVSDLSATHRKASTVRARVRPPK
jgi:hypothetical protein